MASNGRLPDSALRPIPGGRLNAEAAAAWNSMLRVSGTVVYPNGSNSSYRSYAMQVYFWNLYRSGRGNLAAYPGTSNHGWGKAVDTSCSTGRSVVARYGGRFGWRWGEAPSECWHVTYYGGYSGGDPGAGGVSPAEVKKLQVRLQAWMPGYSVKPDGKTGPVTRRAVRDFQYIHGLTVDGKVGPRTKKQLNRPRILTETEQRLVNELWVLRRSDKQKSSRYVTIKKWVESQMQALKSAGLGTKFRRKMRYRRLKRAKDYKR